MKFKRLIAAVTAAATSVSILITGPDRAEKPFTDQESSTADPVSVEGMDSLGRYMTQLTGKDTPPDKGLTASAAEHHYSLSALTFDPVTMTATAESSQTAQCILKITIIDDAEKAVFSSAEITVGTGENIISNVKLPVSSLPEYYLVTAMLVDSMGSPLTEPFNCNYFTKEMQEVKAADIYDFDAERVVNFDSSPDTNFIVLSEDTVISESNENVNTLISADYDKGEFVFSNASDVLTDLKKGQDVYIQRDDSSSIAVKVESVQINDDTLTIKGSDEDAGDIFEFVKIETIADTNNCTYDLAEEEGLEISEPDRYSGGNNLESYMASGSKDEVMQSGATLSFPVKYENKDKTLKIEGKISLGINVKLNFYKKLNYTYTDLGVEMPTSVSVEAEGSTSDYLSFPLAEFIVAPPIPIANITFEIKIETKASVSVKLETSMKPKFGFTFDSDKDDAPKTYSKNEDDSKKSSIELEGKIYFGLVIEPSLNLISKHICSVKFKVSVGFEITGKTSLTFNGDNSLESNLFVSADTSGDSIHPCGTCIEGEINFVTEVSGNFTFLNFMEFKITLAKITKKISDWYFSTTKGFGAGTCPNIAYKLTVNVVTDDKEVLKNGIITIDDQEIALNGNDSVSIYCKNGQYSLSLMNKDMSTYSQYVTIHDGKKTIAIKETSEGKWSDVSPKEVTTTTTTVTTTTETTTTTTTYPAPQLVAAGDFDDCDIHYAIWDNHEMIVYGSGDIPDYDYPPFVYPIDDFPVEGEWYLQSPFDYVQRVDVINSDESNPITRIGNHFFDNCNNITEISIPETVTEIGEKAIPCYKLEKINLPKGLKRIESYAFENSGLVSVDLPEGLEYLGQCAFEDCRNLKEVSIPASITEFLPAVFRNCDELTKVDIAEGLKVIGSNAFENCDGLTEITIPYGVKELNYTFEDCKNLEKIVIPDSVTKMDYTFLRCENLKDVTLSKNVTYIKGTFAECTSLEEITLPESVENVSFAFQGCTSLKKAVLPARVSIMDEESFNNCEVLESITFLNPNLYPIIYVGFNRAGAIFENLIIYGYNKSKAEEFAKEYEYKFVSLGDYLILGDANCDNELNMADAVLIMQSIANPDKFGENGTDKNHITEQGMENADCCNVGDGVTNADALAIQKYMLSLITSLPEKK